MHRATPANSSFRAYSAGGARALLQKVGEALPFDDLKEVQEVAASFMRGEMRKGIEHMQQYGMTSVPFDPDEGKNGAPGLGPEAFVQFIGGNRSFPSMGPVDDRRHRMRGLAPGDVSIFSGKESGQNLHLNGIGTFLSQFPGKKMRLQIVEKAQAAAGGASTFANGDGATGKADAKEELGQKPNYKNESTRFLEINDDGLEATHKKHSFSLPDGTAVVIRDGQVFLGGDPDKGHTFAKVLTEGGVPSINVNARIG